MTVTTFNQSQGQPSPIERVFVLEFESCLTNLGKYDFKSKSAGVLIPPSASESDGHRLNIRVLEHAIVLNHYCSSGVGVSLAYSARKFEKHTVQDGETLTGTRL